jgi:hypothetical protein
MPAEFVRPSQLPFVIRSFVIPSTFDIRHLPSGPAPSLGGSPHPYRFTAGGGTAFGSETGRRTESSGSYIRSMMVGGAER